MTHHVHLLVTPTEEMAVSRMMQYIGRRYALNRGFVLGTEKFKSEVEELTDKRARPLKRGRPAQ